MFGSWNKQLEKKTIAVQVRNLTQLPLHNNHNNHNIATTTQKKDRGLLAIYPNFWRECPDSE